MTEEQKIEALSQAYARLTVHDFALEVIMANWLSFLSNEERADFLRGFEHSAKKLELPGWPAADEAWISQWMADVRTLQARFLERVTHRADEIKAGRSQADAGPQAP